VKAAIRQAMSFACDFIGDPLSFCSRAGEAHASRTGVHTRRGAKGMQPKSCPPSTWLQLRPCTG
jgi:hypothetical protein